MISEKKFGGDIITDDGRGISPMVKFTGMGKDLKGYSAADMIVGVANIPDPEEGYKALFNKIQEMRKNN